MRAQESIPKSDMPGQSPAEKIPFFATSRGKIISGLILLCIVAFILAQALSPGNGSVSFAADETKLGVVFSGSTPVYVSYDEITSIELADTVKTDAVISAKEWNGGFAGIYHNAEYGNFTMYAYSSTGEYIIVRYGDNVLVFNGKNKKTTEQFYNKLTEKLNE